MLFNFAIISSFLLASAAPADHRHEQRQFGRAEVSTDFTSNLSGAILNRHDGTLVFATGIVTVPSVTHVNVSSASVWLGIGDHSCPSGSLRAGVLFYDDGRGPQYLAWNAWNATGDFNTIYNSDFPVSPGDQIRISISGYENGGIAVIDNITQKTKPVMKWLSSTEGLCGNKAVWAVEAFDSSLPEFGPVTFTDTNARDIGGNNYKPADGASIVNIKQNGHSLTSVRIKGSSVIIKRN